MKWSLLFVAALIIAMEIILSQLAVPNYILPKPSDVWLSLVSDRSAYFAAFVSTATSVAIGFLLSAIFGTALAVLANLFRGLQKILLPLCLFFQTVPLIAVAPLFVIWFGFGQPTVVASCIVVSFFPILANTMLGFERVLPLREELFAVYKFSRWQKLLQLQVPSAIPSWVAGLRIGVGLCVVGAVVGEFVAGGGLGGIVDSARTQQKTEMVFAAVGLSCLLGFLLLGLLAILRQCLKKYFYEGVVQ